MSSLPKCILKIGKEIVTYYCGQAARGTPPYFVYVYPPKQEYAVRNNLSDLQAWLQTQGIKSVAISLASLLWQAIDEWGFDSITKEERRHAGDEDALNYVLEAIAQILQGPPSLADRVLQAIGNVHERSAVFLYRAGALYPVFRTSALLDELRERLLCPVVLLYPGRVVGLYGLSFMGRCQPAHGYRATIVVREGT